jgi:hypothetical protein
MRLERLAKDADSGEKQCPSVDLDLDAGDLVVTGPSVDTAQLENVLPGEGAVRIKPDVVLEAMRRYRAR